MLLLLILALLADASSFIMELFNTDFSIFECVYAGEKKEDGKGKQCADGCFLFQ